MVLGARKNISKEAVISRGGGEGEEGQEFQGQGLCVFTHENTDWLRAKERQVKNPGEDV